MTRRGTFLCALLLASTAGPAQAHRLDEYLQATIIRVTNDGVDLYLRLVPGVDVAPQVWNSIDTDGNGALSPAEQQAYAEQVRDDLTLCIDGREARLEIAGSAFPAKEDVSKGVGQISLRLQSHALETAGTHHLHFASRHAPAMSVYLVNTLVPADQAISVGNQQRSVDQAVYDMDFTRRAK